MNPEETFILKGIKEGEKGEAELRKRTRNIQERKKINVPTMFHPPIRERKKRIKYKHRL